MGGWLETCRDVVSPWECDITEHFTIAYYFDRLADAASTMAQALGFVRGENEEGLTKWTLAPR